MEAREELERAAADWDGRASWLETAAEMLRQRDWDGAMAAGDHLVSGTRGVQGWEAFGHAVRAIAMEATGDAVGARAALEARDLSPLPNDKWPMEWCLLMDRLGHARVAGPWLARLEKDAGARSDYWMLRARAAMASGNHAGFLKAADHVGAMPGNVDWQMDRAWVALVLGREAGDVLSRLDSEEVQVKGGERGRILTAWALARSGSRSRAEAMLRDMEGMVKDPNDRALALFALLELLLGQGRHTEALERYRAIEVARLPGPLVLWLEKEMERLWNPHASEVDRVPGVQRGPKGLNR